MATAHEYAMLVLEQLDRLTGHKVMVVGDIGLDEYVFGNVRRISPEAPVPVVDVEKEELRLGLAANVAQNIASLGGVPILIGTVGKDDSAARLASLLRNANVNPDYLVSDAFRPTTRKMRVMVQNHHIVRVDYERRQFLESSVESAVLQKVKTEIANCSAVIIQDYAKGVVSEGLAQAVVKIAKAHGKPVFADPNRATPAEYYRGIDCMTPNYEESVALSQLHVDDLRPDPMTVQKIGTAILAKTQAKELVITRGKDGMTLFSNGEMRELPTYARQVADVTGAGDTVIAALALAMGAGMSLEHSCALANFAAGVVVSKIGCVPCSLDELRLYARQIPET